MTFIQAMIGTAVLAAAVIVLCYAVILVTDAFCHDDKWPFVGRLYLQASTGLLIIILIFATVIWLLSNGEDPSNHCEPGTEYKESSHYNHTTKTVNTDWWCEAK